MFVVIQSQVAFRIKMHLRIKSIKLIAKPTDLGKKKKKQISKSHDNRAKNIINATGG